MFPAKAFPTKRMPWLKLFIAAVNVVNGLCQNRETRESGFICLVCLKSDRCLRFPCSRPASLYVVFPNQDGQQEAEVAGAVRTLWQFFSPFGYIVSCLCSISATTAGTFWMFRMCES